MKAATALVLTQALAVQGIRIVQSNDDGWAELYIRSFNDALIEAGHQVILSGPAENKSGRGEFVPGRQPALAVTRCTNAYHPQAPLILNLILVTTLASTTAAQPTAALLGPIHLVQTSTGSTAILSQLFDMASTHLLPNYGMERLPSWP